MPQIDPPEAEKKAILRMETNLSQMKEKFWIGVGLKNTLGS